MYREIAWISFNGEANSNKDNAVRLIFADEEMLKGKYMFTMTGGEAWRLIWMLIKCWALHVFLRVRMLFGVVMTCFPR
jgi:hypothetical protein